MEEAVQNGWRMANDFNGDPVLDSLRGDPRYDGTMADLDADVRRMRARVEREGW